MTELDTNLSFKYEREIKQKSEKQFYLLKVYLPPFLAVRSHRLHQALQPAGWALYHFSYPSPVHPHSVLDRSSHGDVCVHTGLQHLEFITHTSEARQETWKA